MLHLSVSFLKRLCYLKGWQTSGDRNFELYSQTHPRVAHLRCCEAGSPAERVSPVSGRPSARYGRTLPRRGHCFSGTQLARRIRCAHISKSISHTPSLAFALCIMFDGLHLHVLYSIFDRNQLIH